MAEPKLMKSRLIPVSGIGSVVEAEQRASSAFLAVLSVVRDLSLELLTPLGASRARNALVETFIEVILPKTKVRPDGLIRVSYGKNEWSAFVEVKTGTNSLTADQINSYFDLAREFKIDRVLTISNEIAHKDGVHPTDGLRVRSNSTVQVSHISWSAIVSSALRIKRHKGVDDPEQSWLLEELIRYLQHPASGALDFSDMGSNWVAIRDGAREGTLTKRTEGIEDVTTRWDQLLRFGALGLSADIGEDVDLVFARGQKDVKQRTSGLIDSLSESGVLGGSLRIPNTIGDLSIEADLRARQLTAFVDVSVPQDKGLRGRISWLVSQLDGAPGDLAIESYPKNARTCTSATLAQIRDDRFAILDDDRRETHRFRVVKRAEMGAGRKTGTRSPGFIDTVLALINDFYGDVVQQITPWQPSAPKRAKQPAPEVEVDEAPMDAKIVEEKVWSYEWPRSDS
jgi:hypothetical protein